MSDAPHSVTLAELEVFHSRPIAPTRRLALGRRFLPMAPDPGFGGILLGGVVAAHSRALDADLTADLRLLIARLENGGRVPQPRLRHRLQVDRVGLSSSRMRLVRERDRMRFDFDDGGSPSAYVLAAVYAAGDLPRAWRGTAMRCIRRGLVWTAAPGPRLIAHLSGANGPHMDSVGAFADPVQWALEILELEYDDIDDRRGIQRRFRREVRRAHPDHGGATHTAALRIAELDQARRILLAGADQ